MSIKDIQELESLHPIDDEYDIEEIDKADPLVAHLQEIGIEEVPLFEYTIPQNKPVSPRIYEVIETMRSYCLPLLYLDNNLMIVNYTEQAVQLFRRHYTLQNASFTNLFYKSFDSATLTTFFGYINNAKEGSQWTGLQRHKCASEKMLITKVLFIPIFEIYPTGSYTSKSPCGFAVFFQDVTQEQENFLKSTFNSILMAARLKDNDTERHSERVNFYSKRMAYVLYQKKLYPQVDMDFVENIGSLAAMHDVGKIGTPDAILQKQGALTEDEWKTMWEHTVNGAFILDSHPIQMAKEIALRHHERWDGSGYPHKLEGEMIPLSARIVAIADVYDALRMRRTYKKPISHVAAVKSIVAGTGTHFDPALVEVFLTIEKEFSFIWDTLQDNHVSDIQIKEIERIYHYEI